MDTVNMDGNNEECWPDIPISQDELDNPSSTFVCGLYNDFRSKLISILEDIVEETSEYLHPQPDDSTSIFSLLRYINKYLGLLLNMFGESSITLTDLYEPTAKRTSVNFKLAQHIITFYCNQVDTAKNIINNEKSIYDKINQKKNEIRELKVNLAKQAETIAKNNDNLEKTKEQAEEYRRSCLDLKAELAEKQKFCQEKLHKLKGLETSHQNKQQLLNDNMQTIEVLQKQIISKEEFASKQERKIYLVDKCNTFTVDIEHMQSKMQDRKPVIEHFENVKHKIDDLVKLSEDFKAVYNDVNKKQSQLKDLQLVKTKKFSELEQIKKSIIDCTKNITSQKNSSDEFLKKHKLAMRKIKESIDQLQKQLIEEESIQNDTSKNKLAIQDKITKQKLKNDKIVADTEELMQFYTSTYQCILDAENTTTDAMIKFVSN